VSAYKGKIAIMTGGASGIGRSMAEELARRGAEVVVADLQEELAAEVAEGIRAAGGAATAARLDVTDAEAFDALVAGTIERAGRLDYLFNNAGLAVGGEASRYTLDDWRLVLDVDLRGVVHGVQAAYTRMIAQGSGHIVNTASMAGLVPTPVTVAYCAAKHAVVGLSASLRVEAAHYGVHVSVVCPGVIRTPILVGGGRYGKLLHDMSEDDQLALWEQLKPMDADVFARKTLDAVARNKAIIIHPAWWRFVWWLTRMWPGLARWIGGRSLADVRAKVEETGDSS
jgi:NAD(P)-dependent dehydrogenase (short-subunit alcohol dehydrogenase family)